MPRTDIDEFLPRIISLILELETHTSYVKKVISFRVAFWNKNILNAYQNDFDTGKNRDSYIYGPSVPHTLFAGLRLRSI